MPVYFSILLVVVFLGGISFAWQTIQRPEKIVAEKELSANKEVTIFNQGVEMDIGGPTYIDGTYTTSFAYEIPYNQIEPMEVSLVFENGVITDATIALEADNLTSEEYQKWFLEYFKDEVVGQLIDVVSLSRVAGASLTNNAFDVALAAAKAEARGQEFITPAIVPLEIKMYERNVTTENFEDESFEDGTYTVEDVYFVMAGLFEPMRTTITLVDGVITDAEVVFNTQDIHSEFHQRDFVAVYKSQVIGTSITEVPFSRIGGASLTTAGFNDALGQVMSQAQEK